MEPYIVGISTFVWFVITIWYGISFSRYSYYLYKTPTKFKYCYKSKPTSVCVRDHNNKSIFGVVCFGLILTTPAMIVTAFGYPLFYILYLKIIVDLNNSNTKTFIKLIKYWTAIHAKHFE